MDDRELDEILAELKERSEDEEMGGAPKTEPIVIPKAEEPETSEEPEIPEEPETPEAPEEPEIPEEPETAEAPEAEEEDAAPEEIFSIVSEEPSKEAFDEEGELSDEALDGEEPPEGKKNKKALIISIAVVLIIAIAAGIYFGFLHKKPEPETTAAPTTTTTTTEPTTEEVKILNPLTGEGDFNEAAVGRRPVALVVENHPQARPQWGIGSSDIITEFEVEGGISRMVWLYADYTSLPKQVGPMRSARPPFVKYSKLFDAIFIHWGGSHSSGNYTGGYETISAEGVDDIDGMNGGALFGRDRSRGVSSEHTGVLYGESLEDAIANKGYRTELKEESFSKLSFNDEIKAAGEADAQTIGCKFSSRTDRRDFTYSSDDGKYHTSDWQTDVAFQNVIILMDNTVYVTVPYKGSTTTYCNYSYEGGSGYYASNGTVTEITWEVSNGRLSLKASDGSELKLNPGKSYIGMASANNSGNVSYN